MTQNCYCMVVRSSQAERLQMVSEAERICLHGFVTARECRIDRAMGTEETEKECTTVCKSRLLLEEPLPRAEVREWGGG